MIHIFRKHQQTLWIILTFVVIISFVWFFNGNQGGRGGGLSFGNTVATINGEKVRDVDLQRDVRRSQVALQLGLTDLARALAGNADSEGAALENFVWNTRVLRHEAEVMQIVPSAAELQAALEKVPAFQTNGQFDGAKLSQYVQEQLPARGFTDAIIDDLMADVVRLDRIRELVGATVTISPTELESRYRDENQKMDLAVVRLHVSDFEKTVTVSDDEARKAYEARKDQIKSDEARQVKVAAFEMTPAQKELKGKERTDVLQALANTAWDFTQAMLAPQANFEEAAQKAGAAVSLSGTFTAAQPDPALVAKAPAIGTSTFQLTAALPTSDVLEGQNGYYVVHLEGVTPSRPLTFEEAKPQLVEEIKKQKAGELLQSAAGTIREKLDTALQSGMSFADAAKSVGLAAETIPPFSLVEAAKADVPDNETIVRTAVGLGEKQLSQYVPTDAGGLFVFMAGREPIPDASLTVGEEVVKASYRRNSQEMAFAEWLRLARLGAHLQVVQRHY